MIAVPITHPRAMKIPHTNHTSKAFADITGTIKQLLLKMSATNLNARGAHLCRLLSA